MPQVFNLVHLTDFHLFQARGASWCDFLNKRALSYLSWRLRRAKKNSPAVLSAIIDFMTGLDWDQVAITGDLTHMGLPLEYRQARYYLERLGPPEDVFVIPGNHDALTSPSSETCFDNWGRYMASGSRQTQMSGPGDYPIVRLRKGVALIGLSSACSTPPFSAAGRLGRAQCRRLASILEITGRHNLFRILLIHHPLVAGQVTPRKSLRDAATLRTTLARHGAELVLHGHTHHHSHLNLPGPVVPVPVIGLPSSTSRHSLRAKRACLRMYAIQPTASGWKIDVHDHHVDRHSGEPPDADTTSLASWQTRPNVGT